MPYQAVFKRYELKYLLTKEQKSVLLTEIEKHMALDQYGRSTIRNIYFDTDNYRLIRRSIEKPAYKEKLRIRCYQKATPETEVFVELKKKYRSIVYKRRIAMPEKTALEWLCNKTPLKEQTQISNEIDYFLDYYKTLHPVAFLSYVREAYYCKDGSDLRVTFDEQILCRQTELSLESDIAGTSILDSNLVLMEIKCSGGIPLWMTKVLSAEHIYKTSFSKYGTAYQTFIYPKWKKENNYVKTVI